MSENEVHIDLLEQKPLWIEANDGMNQFSCSAEKRLSLNVYTAYLIVLIGIFDMLGYESNAPQGLQHFCREPSWEYVVWFRIG